MDWNLQAKCWHGIPLRLARSLLRPVTCTCLGLVGLVRKGAGEGHQHRGGVVSVHDAAVVHTPVLRHQLHQRGVGGRAAEGAHAAAGRPHRCLSAGKPGALLGIGDSGRGAAGWVRIRHPIQ